MTEQDGVSRCDSTVYSVKLAVTVQCIGSSDNKMSVAVTVRCVGSSDRTRLTKSEVGDTRNVLPLAYCEVLSRHLDLAVWTSVKTQKNLKSQAEFLVRTVLNVRV